MPSLHLVLTMAQVMFIFDPYTPAVVTAKKSNELDDDDNANAVNKTVKAERERKHQPEWCPDDYYYNQGNWGCYRAVRDEITFDEAKAECQKSLAHLLIINSERSHQVLLRYINEVVPWIKRGNEWPYIWAGIYCPLCRAHLIRENETRQFVSIFNRSLEGEGFSRWAEGEPNNLWGEEHCGSIHLESGLYNDAPCDAVYKFICQIEVRMAGT